MGQFGPKHVGYAAGMDEPHVFSGAPEGKLAAFVVGEAGPVGGTFAVGDCQ